MDEILVLAVFDVSEAHFYGVCERDVYVKWSHPQNYIALDS